MSYVVWLGGVFDETTMLSRPAVSPAGNRWQSGLISGLESNGVRTVILGHLPEPAWPRGQLFVDANKVTLSQGLTGELVSYVNLPAWREHAWCTAYTAAFKRLCRERGKPLALVSYNAPAFSRYLGTLAEEELGVPWIPIIADVPESEADRQQHDQMVRRAAGRVYLSWGSYLQCLHSPKLHLDGGVGPVFSTPDPRVINRKDLRQVIMYTGTLNRYGGVSFLVDGFRRVQNHNAELWICGKGTNQDVERAAALDPRIKPLGLVTDERLRTLSEMADIFINPRPSSIPENHCNFPSKVLEYLSYGKPVISTWTEGLSPEYRKVLVLLEEETAECLGQSIESVLAWSPGSRQKLAHNITSFLEPHKTWSSQGRRFVEWLHQEVLSCKVV